MSVESRRARGAVRLFACGLALGAAGCLASDGRGSAAVRSAVAPPAPAARQDPSKLARPLQDFLATVDARELVPVLIVLTDQATEAEKAAALLDVPAGLLGQDRKHEVHDRIVGLLEQTANSTQGDVLQLLATAQVQNDARNVRPLWLVNAVGAEATEAVLLQLTAEDEVERIHLDVPRTTRGSVGLVDAPTWNVERVRAPEVWLTEPVEGSDVLGYTGAGVVVAIVDSGVDLDHPAFAGRIWHNPAEGANPDGTFDPADVDGLDSPGDDNTAIDDLFGYDVVAKTGVEMGFSDAHGTHVAGVVAGGEETEPAVGVAPGATVLSVRVTDAAGLATQTDCLAGIEYAVKSEAHVVNFSAGWKPEWSPDRKSWRKAIENAVDAGVLVVTITGNEGGEGTIRTPGDVPSCLTVGGTTASEPDTHWAAGDTGPVSWSDVDDYHDYPDPPGLTKPDLAAPAESIDSTIPGDDYLVLSTGGSSQSAAHVSGAAALLLECDPGLQPHELVYLLRESAFDVGAPGADDQTGWGRLDCAAALALEIDASPHDLSIGGTTSEWTTDDIWIETGTPDDVEDTPTADGVNLLYARVRNLGGGVLKDVEVKFYYADVATTGIDGFDPDADGDPEDGEFESIGTYVVPVLGPSGSRQSEAVAVVEWDIPVPTGDHWCVGVGVVAPSPPNPVESDVSNNRAFRNFFTLLTSRASFAFRIAPPADKRSDPFTFAVTTRRLPEGSRVWLLVPSGLEPRLFGNAQGFVRAEPESLDSPLFPPAYRDLLRRARTHVRYRLEGEVGRLPGIRSRDGAGFPARIVVDVPPGVPRQAGETIALETFEAGGRVVGGVTLNLVPTPRPQRSGPFRPPPK